MFEREVTLYKFNLKYLRNIVKDLDDTAMNEPAFPGGNPPVWILGHLAMSADSAARLLGLERQCPREWLVQFRPGSKPSDLAPPLPTKDELMASIEANHQRVSEAALAAKPEEFNQPHAVEILKQSVLTTKADVLAHLMCTHESFHIAQLSACRRVTGKGPIV